MYAPRIQNLQVTTMTHRIPRHASRAFAWTALSLALLVPSQLTAQGIDRGDSNRANYSWPPEALLSSVSFSSRRAPRRMPPIA